MINFEEEKINAKVKFSFLGQDNDKGLCFQIGFSCAGDKTVVTDIIPIKDMSIIDKIVRVLEIKSWEEIGRKFARIKVTNGKVTEIGNIIENKWVRL